MDRTREADALAHGVGVCLLPEVWVVRVGGDDAREWLNGQLTNDLREPRPGTAVYALQVDLRGRIVTDAWVLDRGEELLLLLPAALAERALEILDGYIIMEDVELEPRPELRVLSAQGPRATAETVGGEGAFPVGRLGTGGWERLVPASEAEAALGHAVGRAGAAGGLQVHPEGWELARLQHAVPRVEVDCAEGAYPQEAGLHRRAVSFEKGCYVGQEPVVMLEHRGKPPRRLVQLELEGDGAPAPGAIIATPQGQEVGRVTSSVEGAGAGAPALALGFVRRAQAKAGAEVQVDGRAAILRCVVGD